MIRRKTGIFRTNTRRVWIAHNCAAFESCQQFIGWLYSFRIMPTQSASDIEIRLELNQWYGSRVFGKDGKPPNAQLELQSDDRLVTRGSIPKHATNVSQCK